MQTPFINYSPEDEILAKRIYADLLAVGLRPWLLGFDRLPGDDIARAQERALAEAGVMVVLLTKKFLRHTAQTALLAQAKTIIPILADVGIKAPDGLPEPIQLKRRYSEAISELIAKLPTPTAPPLDELPDLQCGNEAYHLGDYEGALEYYQEIDAPDAVALHCLGAAYNALRQPEKALEALNQALAQENKLALIYRNRGLAYSAMGHYEEALADDQRAIELETDLPQNWSSSAMTLVNLGRYDEAKTAIQKALELSPANAHYHYQLGIIHSRAGDHAAALAAFDAALALNADHTDSQVARQVALGRLGRYDEALADIDREIKRKPRKAGNYVTRSLVNFYLERYADCVKDATAALERGQEHRLPALYNRAIANWQLGNTAAAEADLLLAISMHPDLSSATGIRRNAESELTSEPAVAILESLIAAGKLTQEEA